MALKYRTEQVISSLRSAYALKHGGQSWLTPHAETSLSPEDLDHSLQALKLGAAVTTPADPEGDGCDAAVAAAFDSELAASQNAKSLMRWKELGLDLGDDSDFEDTLLQAGRTNSLSSSGSSTPRVAPTPPQHKIINTRPRAFSKRECDPVVVPRSSQLSSLLQSRRGDPREQYLEAVAGLREGEGVRYKIHIPGRAPLTIMVKPDCSTHLAIGYTLLKADIPLGDANLYTLRLTEEDGLVDEDFPALDRVRPLASYHTDEFAIIRATEQEYRENCKRTPNKMPFVKNAQPQNSTMRASSGASSSSAAAAAAASAAGDAGAGTNAVGTNAIGTVGTTGTNTVGPAVLGAATTSALAPAAVLAPATSTSTANSAASNGTNGASTNSTVQNQIDGGAGGNTITVVTSNSNSTNAKIEAPKMAASAPQSGPRPQVESILVRVYMYPYDPLLSPVFWSDDMVSRQTPLRDVFERMCRDKMMDPEMFILRTADPTRKQIDLQKPLLSLIQPPNPQQPALGGGSGGSGGSGSGSGSGGAQSSLCFDMEVVALRNLPGGTTQSALRPRASSKNGDTSMSSTTDTSMPAALGAAAQQPHTGGIGGATTVSGSANASVNSSVLAMQQPFGFYKYPVVRQKVLGGSAKELVIDGENIHIMPPSDRSMVDQPKTTSFHVRQVIRVKQSKKTNTNFSIAVMKPGGPKTYDLECETPQLAGEIVDCLQRLKSARK